MRTRLLTLLIVLGATLPIATHAQSWTPLTSGVTNDLNDIDCVDERTCYVVGGAPFIGGPGIMLKTTNGGEGWSAQSIPTTNPLRGISCPSPLVCYAAGDGGVILKTVDGGAAWVRQSTPNLSTFPGHAQPWFWDIWASTPTTAVAVGNVGAVYRTTNGGDTWTQLVLGLENHNLRGVFFMNATTGWLVGAPGFIHKTVDGGATWIGHSTGTPTLGFDDVFSFDGDTVWASGPFTFAVNSTDGGVRWTQVSVPPAGGMPNIEFTTDLDGWIALNGGMLRTADGGATWMIEALPRLTIYRSINCSAGVVCYAVGDDGTILQHGTPPPPPQADLTVGTQSLQCPATALGIEFAEYRYRVVVTNNGTAASGPFTVRIEGVNAVGASVGTPINRTITDLAAGTSTTIEGQSNVGLLNPTVSATATVRVTADVLSQVTESNEANNVSPMVATCALATAQTEQAQDTIPPSAPGDISLSTPLTDTTPSFAWVAATDNVAVTGYEVRLAESGATTNVIEWTDVGDVRAYTVPDVLALPTGRTHILFVRAKDAAGNVGSVAYQAFSLQVPAQEVVAVEPAAQAPSAAGQAGVMTEESKKATSEAQQPAAAEQPAAAGQPSPEKAAENRTLQIDAIKADAPKMLLGVEKFAEEKQLTRDTALESLAKEKVVLIAKEELVAFAAEKKEEVRGAMETFVAYGTAQTKELGAGERAGVVNSFKEAFGKLPETVVDWEDVMKIAVGRFPSQRGDEREREAVATFRKIYRRDPNRVNANDDAAVVVMSYGLRPVVRRRTSEKAAIKIYKGIFKRAPASASDWDVVRAIAYSGAKR